MHSIIVNIFIVTSLLLYMVIFVKLLCCWIITVYLLFEHQVVKILEKPIYFMPKLIILMKRQDKWVQTTVIYFAGWRTPLYATRVKNTVCAIVGKEPSLTCWTMGKSYFCTNFEQTVNINSTYLTFYCRW